MSAAPRLAWADLRGNEISYDLCLGGDTLRGWATKLWCGKRPIVEGSYDFERMASAVLYGAEAAKIDGASIEHMARSIYIGWITMHSVWGNRPWLKNPWHVAPDMPDRIANLDYLIVPYDELPRADKNYHRRLARRVLYLLNDHTR